MFRKTLAFSLLSLFPLFSIAQSSGNQDYADGEKDILDGIHQIFQKDSSRAKRASRKRHIRIGILPVIPCKPGLRLF
jgi:hypothetical protein